MWILQEASQILGTPLGGLVYHLLLLGAVEAGLGMAWGEWQRVRRGQARRLLIAIVGLVVVRVPYVVAALASTAGWADEPLVLLPPLERFADTASIALLGWAFMPPARRGPRSWDLVFGMNLIAAIGVCIGFSIAWSQSIQVNSTSSDYNTWWQATVWDVWQMGLILLAALAVVRNRGMGRSIFLLAMTILFVGRILQLADAGQVAHLPTWERLTNLFAYPLIAVAIYRDIVVGLRVHSRELQTISQASLDQIKSLLFLFDASQQMSGSLDMNVVLDKAVKGIALALESDQCAIAFPEPSDPGVMRLVAIYNPARQGRGEGVTFPLGYQLLVQQAMRRKKHVISEETDNVQHKVLFALLGSSEVGPLLVQPLVIEDDVIGAIIVGNARSRRPFTPNEAKLCQAMAEQVAGAIQNARRYEVAQNRILELGRIFKEERKILQQTKDQMRELADRSTRDQAEIEKLRQREESAREACSALEIKLVSSKAEAEALAKRLAALETDLAQALASSEAQLRWHEDVLAIQRAEWQGASQTSEWIQTVLQGMTAAIVIADVDGVILEANAAAEVLLDHATRGLQGMAIAAVCDDDRWQQAVTAVRGGEAVRLTIQVGTNTLLCDMAPLPGLDDDRESEARVVAVFQDISSEAEERRAQQETLASMADELRTPMTTMANYVDLLLSGAVGVLEAAQRKYLVRVKAGAERMAQMADDLAREASGEVRWTSPQRRTVDVNRLIEGVVAVSHIHLEDKALTLDLDLPEDLPAIKADPDYLRRVLSNLLSNACLASEEGGQIRVWTSQSNGPAPQRGQLDLNGDGFVIISVKDFGGGLPDDALDRVFDRARPSRTPPGLGESGAGLALVKTLVEAHGGRLWVESEYGVGTTFSFVLPVNEHKDSLRSGSGNH